MQPLRPRHQDVLHRGAGVPVDHVPAHYEGYAAYRYAPPPDDSQSLFEIGPFYKSYRRAGRRPEVRTPVRRLRLRTPARRPTRAQTAHRRRR